MASKILKFCFAAGPIAIKGIPNTQTASYCVKCFNTAKAFHPIYFSNSLFSTSVIRRNEKQLTETQDSEESDVLYKRLMLELKGHDPAVIRSYQKFAEMAAKELDIPVSQIYTPKRDITRYTTLKSVHVYKKHKVQYEARTHFKVIEFKYLTGSTADTFLEYLERNLPEGMAMKVTKTRLEKMPTHILQDQLKRQAQWRKEQPIIEDISATDQDKKMLESQHVNPHQASSSKSSREPVQHENVSESSETTNESSTQENLKDSAKDVIENVKDKISESVAENLSSFQEKVKETLSDTVDKNETKIDDGFTKTDDVSSNPDPKN